MWRTPDPAGVGGKQTDAIGPRLLPDHRLQTSAIVQTAAAVAEFAAEARKLRVDWLRIIATSAAREAINAEELSAAIERQAA